MGSLRRWEKPAWGFRRESGNGFRSRAFWSTSRVCWVLDEATANLDYATELEVKHAISTLSPRPTMLVIAHRYTMMKEADYVYVLRNGRVGEQGAPDRLLEKGGWFAELAAHSGEGAETGQRR